MALKVEYKNTDITSRVEVDRCWLDQYAEGQGDTIKIIFTDPSGLWDSWGPELGDIIRVYNNHVDSGHQFVRSFCPRVGKYEIVASAIPVTASQKRRQGWQEVTKLQLASEIAKRHGLELKTYGLTDHKFGHLIQNDESDLTLLQRICLLEGDAFLIYDGALVLYNVEDLEGKTPAQKVQLNADNNPEYYREQPITALTVRNGKTEYTYGTDTTKCETINVTAYIDSQGTAERYASNLFHHLNKNRKCGIFYTSPLADGYSAGSVVTLATKKMTAFDGDAFIYHVRHDMTNNKTKVFFRCIS